MSLAELLGSIVRALDAAGIPHMLAGSVAGAFHGEPRSTQDVDLVIDPPDPASLERFASLLDPDRLYVRARADRCRGWIGEPGASLARTQARRASLALPQAPRTQRAASSGQRDDCVTYPLGL